MRPLDPVWPIVYFDGIVVHVRGANGRVSKHTIYVALGVNLEEPSAAFGRNQIKMTSIRLDCTSWWPTGGRKVPVPLLWSGATEKRNRYLEIRENHNHELFVAKGREIIIALSRWQHITLQQLNAVAA